MLWKLKEGSRAGTFPAFRGLVIAWLIRIRSLYPVPAGLRDGSEIINWAEWRRRRTERATLQVLSAESRVVRFIRVDI